MIQEERRFLRELCLKSLYHFVAIVIMESIPDTVDNPRLDLQPFHKKILDFCQDKNLKRAGILEPRYFLKSTCLTQSMPLWLYLNNHEVRVLIVNEVFGRAKDFLYSIKNQLEKNELLHYLFPEILTDKQWRDKNRWSSEEIDLPRMGIGYKEPTFKCMGVGGAGQGYHGTHIFLDDIIGKKAMMSEVVRMDTEIWFNNVTELLESPDHTKPHGSHIYMIGTHYAPGDIYQKVQDDRPEFQWIKVRAEDEYGNATWPEKLSEAEIARMKSNPSELVKFYTQMQNDPMKTDLSDFKTEWLKGKYYERFDHPETDKPWIRYVYDKKLDLDDKEQLVREVAIDDLTIQGVIDPASLKEGGIRKTARTAVVVAATDPVTNKRIVLEAWAMRISEPEELYACVYRFSDKYPLRSWHIETFATQNWAKNGIVKYFRARGRHCPITDLDKDVGANAKEIRIRGLSDDFSVGDVYLHESFLDLIHEYLSFPMGSTKDLMDALSYFKQWWHPKPTDKENEESQERYQEFVSGRGELGY